MENTINDLALSAPYYDLALPHDRVLPQGKTLVMGVLNMTPDSFSDGGLWLDPGAARAHVEEMLEAGADIIDIGGESTRPGSTRISADEEWDRISSVVHAVCDMGAVVSVDTVHAYTAKRAVDAGAAIINDVSGGCLDPQMRHVISASDVAYVVQHYRALPGQPGEHFDYGDDLIATLIGRMRLQVQSALDIGVEPERIIVDPGLGFSLLPEQCWEIVDNIHRFHELELPILVGASRKRFLADHGEDRDATTARISQMVAAQGVWAVRVHDVARNVQALASCAGL